MKVILELKEVEALINVVRRHLLPDVPPSVTHSAIVKEETTLLLNLLLTQSLGVVDYHHDYLEELDWIDEIEAVLGNFWERKEWRLFFPMNLCPRHFEVANEQGLTLIQFHVGEPRVQHHLRLSHFR